MPLKKLKEFKKRQSGIYVISPQDPKDDHLLFKIGRTIQMNKRLNGYHLCFPDGFWIYHSIMLNATYKTTTKAEKSKTLKKTIEIEKYIHQKLDKYRHESTTRRKHEWFHVDTVQLKQALIECHNEFISDTDYPILGFKEPFYNEFYIDGFEELKILKKELHITKKKPNYMGQKTTKEEGARKSERTRKVPGKFKDSVFFDITKDVKKEWS